MYNFNNNFEVSNTTMVQCNIEASINPEEDQVFLDLKTTQPILEHFVVRLDFRPERINGEKTSSKPPTPMARLRKLWQALIYIVLD